MPSCGAASASTSRTPWSSISRNGTTAFIGVPEREAAKLEELWARDELGVELSVDVRAPVVVGVFPMRIARYTVDHSATDGIQNGHGAWSTPPARRKPPISPSTRSR